MIVLVHDNSRSTLVTPWVTQSPEPLNGPESQRPNLACYKRRFPSWEVESFQPSFLPSTMFTACTRLYKCIYAKIG